MNNQQQDFSEKIRLIHNLGELQGSCYFEILPGKYEDKCWNQNSVFMTEDSFSYLEPIFENRVSNFDHYSFVKIAKDDWLVILADFDSLLSILGRTENIEKLEREIDFVFRDSVGSFADDFQASKIDLMILIKDFSEWVQNQLKSQECISVLGI
jgi:hypothetical protein